MGGEASAHGHILVELSAYTLLTLHTSGHGYVLAEMSVHHTRAHFKVTLPIHTSYPPHFIQTMAMCWLR